MPSWLRRWLLIGVAIVLAFFTGLGEFDNWPLALRFLDRTAYGATDPIFGRDIGFYLFALPAYVLGASRFFKSTAG